MNLPKLPFRLTELREGLAGMFSFSRREIIITAVSVAVILVTAVVITAVVISVRRPPAPEPVENLEYDAAVSNPSDKPFLSDFMLYEDGLEESFTGVIYSRQPSDYWSAEQVDKFWIDPREIAAEQLELETEKIIMDIFADVP